MPDNNPVMRSTRDSNYMEDLPNFSSSRFVSSPKKNTKKSKSIQQQQLGRNVPTMATGYQTRNKDLSKTGSNIVTGCDSNNMFPPPPHQTTLESLNNQYEYSSSDAYAEFNQHLIDQKNYTSNPNVVIPCQGPQIHTSKTVFHQHLSGDEKEKDCDRLDINSSCPASTNNRQKDWIPMRQLYNAHKL